MKKLVYIIIFGLSLLCYKQGNTQNISGTYTYRGQTWSADLTLAENRFKMSSGINTNHDIDISSGYYLVLKDTLFLFYQKQEDNSPSSFTIQKQVDSSMESTIVSFKIVDEANAPMPGVSIAMKSKDNSPVLTLLSNSTGEVDNVCLPEGGIVDNIDFHFIGYKSLTIKLSNIEKGVAEIIVTLKRDRMINYNKYERTEKFLLVKKAKSFSFQQVGAKGSVIFLPSSK